MASSLDRRERLRQSHLYLVAPARSADGCSTLRMVEAALAGGVDIVQLRDKQATDREIVDMGRALKSACATRGALLIINDRPELALECDADGVHLGQDDQALQQARRRLGTDLLIGISTHSAEQIARGGASTADYLGVGPVHRTPTKPQAEPVGIELVRHASAVAGKPFFAIGGINELNVCEVVAAGATRIAVVRAICEAADPSAAAAELSGSLERRLVGGASQ